MFSISHHDSLAFLIALGVILLSCRLFGELARKIKMPLVLGEIIAGIILGKSVLGNFFPETFDALFPFVNDTQHYPQANTAFDTMVMLAIIMLMFVAGIEVNLPMVIQKRKSALLTTFFSMAIPLAVGIFFVMITQGTLHNQSDPWTLGLFLGLILSVTALPIVAKILMDMNLFSSSIGTTIIASSMFIDLLGWLGFSVLINRLEVSEAQDPTWKIVLNLLIFGALILTLGTRLLNLVVPWVQKKLAWPGGILALLLGFCFLGAAFTQYIGIHYVLGAFIIGMSVGDCSVIKSETIEIIHQFILNIFAPFFFAYLGLKVDFFNNFNGLLFLVILLIAFGSKTIGSTLGARLSGMNFRDSLSVGVGMNTHGSLEIILCSIALKTSLITAEMFVALMLAIIVSIVGTGPLLKWVRRGQ